MGLEVYITRESKLPRIGEEYEFVLQFSNDGYFWFLYPLFKELEEATGQTIELYEDAFFFRLLNCMKTLFSLVEHLMLSGKLLSTHGI